VAPVTERVKPSSVYESTFLSTFDVQTGIALIIALLTAALLLLALLRLIDY